MKTLNVLHIASFQGNIGDVANHTGFYSKFSENIYPHINITEIEIRQFYKKWNKRKFDINFAEEANQYDLVIIGGGNFFELCWDYSVTGTTINISNDVLGKIKTPILFNGVGVDDGKGINEGNIKKFGSFLEKIVSSNQFYFTVRNDGSLDILKKYYPDKIVNSIKVVPDSGFFIKNQIKTITPNSTLKSGTKKKKYIGINVAGDMLNIRFSNEKKSYDEFKDEFSKMLNKLLDENPQYDLIFFPHVQLDYLAIMDIVNLLKDEYSRTRISITSLIQGKEMNSFTYYNECEVILGMRFHSNVCAIGLGIPTIGLITYHKHGEVYREIGLEDRAFYLNKRNCYKEIEIELRKIIEDNLFKDIIIESYLQKNLELKNQIDVIHSDIKIWLENKKII